ncbi:DNA internalization-related competence protein ComEC/Rec2 [Enterococcus sp. N342-3-1-2]
MIRLFNTQQNDSYLFLGVILALGTTAYLVQSVCLALLTVYYFMMLVWRRQAFLCVVVLCCCVVIAARIYWTQTPTVAEGSFSGSLSVRSDTIKINGDLVTFEGKMALGKVMVRLQVQTEAEKEQWQRRQDWQGTITGDGRLVHPQGASNKHGFDYAAYLENHNFVGTIELTDWQKSTEDQSVVPLRKWRAAAITHVQRVFPSRISIYINALLFGYKDHEFQVLRDLFSGSGLLHFFTISGMHVAFFFQKLTYIFRRLHFTPEEMCLPVLCCLGGSIVLFGGSISVIRAVLVYMLNALMTARAKSWSASDRYGIILTILLIIAPKLLLQLSGQLCLLMTFLLLMTNSLRPRFHRFVSGQLLTLLAGPILACLFFEIPLFGGLATVLFYPLMTTVLLPGVFLLFVMSLVVSLAPVIAIAEICLDILEGTLFHLRHGSLTIGVLPVSVALLCTIVGVICYQQRKVLLLLVVTILVPIGYQKWQVVPTISFVDVGQGDSIVIQEKRNRGVYVIDTGGTLGFERQAWQQRSYQSGAAYSLVPFLKGEGINEITGLFLTHGDTDHIGDALFLMQSIPVRTLYLVPGSQEDPRIAALLKDMPASTEVIWTEIGQRIGNEQSLHVLAPTYGEGQNEDSLVLQAHLGSHSFLFTGDLDQAGELDLLAHYPALQVDVLKLGHHGSRTSTAEAFIEGLSPRYGIVSCGRNNRYGHPHQEVLDRLMGSAVLRTDHHGMIQFSWSENKQQLTLQTWLDEDNQEW